MDTVVRGGTVVTASSEFVGDVGIQDGKIAQIGGSISAPQTIDATGKLVVPGGVDVHVHFAPWGVTEEEALREGGTTSDDFYSGTQAAVAGGVTSVGNMVYLIPHKEPSLLKTLEMAAADAEAKAICDFTNHPVIIDPSPEAIAEIPRLVDEGYTSIKIFLSFGFIGREEDYLKVMEAAGKHGILSMVHCEDEGILNFTRDRLLSEGNTNIRYYPESRPVCAETAATAKAVAMAEATHAPIYVVHLSSTTALEETRKGRTGGQQVYVETRPIYLYLTSERYNLPDGAKDVGEPPLREQSDVEALWEGLRIGDIHTLCSDHAPWTLSQKLNPALKIGGFYAGVASLETQMPMLYSEGVLKGKVSLNRWVEVTATNAAKLFGMYPQKGTISVGSDADIVVWDPDLKRTIRGEEMHSKSGFDVFEGREVQGWPVYTLSRGEIVYEKGEIKGSQGRGRRIERGLYRPL